MEDNQLQQLELTINEDMRNTVLGIIKWSKFLAIIGFVLTGVMILFAIMAKTIYANLAGMGDMPMMKGMGTALTTVYALISIIYFLPFLFLFRFASQTKNALDTIDQRGLSSGFNQLKNFFGYVGILTLIGLFFMAIGLIGIMGGGMMNGF